MPDSGEQETLHYKAQHDLFFIRLLLSRAGDTADLPNTQQQTQRIGKNERQRNIFQMKEQGKITERELKERKICKTPMVINLVMELQKRVEDLSEILNKEMENIKKETIKDEELNNRN